MVFEPNWDEWEPLDLILDERVSAFTQYVRNFILTGFGLANGVGLQIAVGGVGFNLAYINGYAIKVLNTTFRPLQPNATNYIYIAFTKTADPIGGAASINIFIAINQTGIAPSNSLFLGTAVTNGVGITAITQVNNHFHIGDAQFDTDIDGNQHQITNLVLHEGTAFPTNPAPIAGQVFYRTDLFAPYVFNGQTWDILIGALTATAGELLMAGEFVRIQPLVNNTVLRTLAASSQGIEVIGAAKTPAALGQPLLILSGVGQRITAQFETGLTPQADQDVFLSATVPGALTTVAPPLPKLVGKVIDASGYIGTLPSNSKADIVFQLSGGGGSVDPRDIMRYSMMSEGDPDL